MGLTRGMMTSARPDWETPPELFERYRALFNLDLDVCATEANAKLPRFFTPEQDGLAQDWSGARCWMNPPYGREIVKWVRKASLDSLAGRVPVIVGLVPARTCAAWWHDWVLNPPNTQIEFLRGRLRFVGGAHAAPFPSAVVVWHRGAANCDKFLRTERG